MEGFFSESLTISQPPPSIVPKCGLCKLLDKCESPLMKVDGRGKQRILIVGEAPTATEDKEGIPFCGKSGLYLQNALKSLDIDLREDCWTTNSIICRPSTETNTNRFPTDKEIDYCRPNIIQTIQTIQPDVIILLGGSAVKSVIGWIWKEDVKQLARWVNWQIPSQKLNAWICPTYHPAFLIREQSRYKDDDVAHYLFVKHLKKAISKVGFKPWQTVPDYRQNVDVIMDPETAAKCIRKFVNIEHPVAFDIESDGLKPESDDIEIVTASMSDGKFTFAFPFHGEAITAFKEFVSSRTPKLGYNTKFETRFIRKKLGLRVRNWIMDGMIAAHVLDNRRGITSLKFQSFVLLGQPSYDDSIKPYFKSKGSNKRNRIREIDIHQLLTYGGLDALLEFKVDDIMANQLGINIYGEAC